jgi:iron complex transport system substrate-binding protein
MRIDRPGLVPIGLRAMRLCATLLLFFASHFLATMAGAAPKRIASINLCADQMLIALSATDKIVALGPFARDPGISFYAREAVAFPQLAGRSEEIIGLGIDAIAVGPFDNKFMRAVFERRQIKEIVVDRWTTLSGVRSGVQDFADRIQEPDAGRRLVDDIDRALSELRPPGGQTQPDSFVIFQRRGFVGETGIVSELLAIAGLRDAAQGVRPGFMGVEGVIALRPTFLVLSDQNPKSEDRGLELLTHPALRRLYPESRRIIVPDKLTACAGPSTPALIRRLRDQLERNVWVK